MIRSIRFVAPAAVTLLALVGAVLGQQSAARTALALALVVGAVAVASVRGASGWPLVGLLAVAAVGFWLLAHGQSANLGWFGYSAIAGWAGTRAGARPTAVFTVGLVAVVALQLAGDTTEPGWFAWAAGAVFSASACSMARRQGELLQQLQEAQAGLAERTRAEERNRIAAEMHDVIGHALTVSLLHVGTARLAIEEGDTAEALGALDLAETQSRRSLEEVRASVGALRASAGTTTPLPGAGDLTALVEDFRATGTPVECEVTGDLATVPAATGLAAYRIVQEALTNAARHAPGHTARVAVDVGERTRVQVRTGARPGPRTTGTGLLGMRERAESVGGTCTAGPDAGGWRVEAVL